jgi:hypothetical protein
LQIYEYKYDKQSDPVIKFIISDIKENKIKDDEWRMNKASQCCTVQCQCD